MTCDIAVSERSAFLRYCLKYREVLDQELPDAPQNQDRTRQPPITARRPDRGDATRADTDDKRCECKPSVLGFPEAEHRPGRIIDDHE